jgi:hypothetical protein
VHTASETTTDNFTITSVASGKSIAETVES